jgi:hypothetical protein
MLDFFALDCGIAVVEGCRVDEKWGGSLPVLFAHCSKGRENFFFNILENFIFRILLQIIRLILY